MTGSMPANPSSISRISSSKLEVGQNLKASENAIWTYETPFPAMAEISGYLAFYPDKVRIEQVP